MLASVRSGRNRNGQVMVRHGPLLSACGGLPAGNPHRKRRAGMRAMSAAEGPLAAAATDRRDARPAAAASPATPRAITRGASERLDRP